ncbi:hypothetical protein EON79_04690 [bacterium]|nr:MAG: hypothetical protein EON79_04690 [bacterium]
MSTSLVAAALLFSPVPQAAPKKPQGQKPVLGQVQMAGDNGKMGTTYSLGDKGGELNFTLDTAEFVLRAPMVDDTIVAKKGEKILLLTFTVANPQKADQKLNYTSLKFTAVAPDDKNSEFDGYFYHPDRKTRFDTSLKPAQKVKVTIPFPIHGIGPVNKLIVKRGGGKVLRYDLREKVEPLAGPFAKDGTNALEKADSEAKRVFALGKADVAVYAVETFDEGLGDYKPSGGQQIVGITVTVQNPGLQPFKMTWNTFRPTLLDENGEACEWTQDLLGMSSNRTVDQEIAPDGQIRARYVFRVAKGVKPAKLTLLDAGDSQRSMTVTLP